MKKNYLIIIFVLVLLNTSAQGFKLKLISDIQADSVVLKVYNQTEYSYQSFLKQPYQKELTFTYQNPLTPGIYLLLKDTFILAEFFVSSTKNQNYTIEFKENKILFKGSPENEANQTYIKKMQEYDSRIQALDAEFQELKKRNLPQYMLQSTVDTLAVKADSIMKEKKEYQQTVIQQQSTSLLGSLIQSTMEMETPPKEYYSNREKYFKFVLEHSFDTYKWEDDRLINTPLPGNKFKFISQIILELNPVISTPIVISTLEKSKISEKHYYAFFDYLEVFFGSITSPYRDETLYIAMLKNALLYPQLSPERKARYESELKIIDKNLAGSKIPDFSIILSNGDTTSLYKIEAEYMLLYFQNPDCHSCIELRQKMESMDYLKKAISDKKLKVITIFFESNPTIWNNYLKTVANPNYIHSWNYDQDIELHNLFDTRTIPMLILVDKDKKVIKKDLMSNEIENYMKMINP
jgi:hypothetical protein